MPTYTVTAPDGKEYEVTAPKGATKEEIIRFVEHKKPQTSAFIRFGQGSAIGIAQLLGGDKAQELFNKLGIAPSVGTKPEGLAGEAGNITGQSAAIAATLIAPFTRAAGAISAGAIPETAGVARTVGTNIARTAIEHPAGFATAEVVSSISAATGGHIVQQKYPDSLVAKALGQIVGGVALPFAGAVLQNTPSMFRTTARGARHFVGSLRPKGGRARAVGRVDRAVEGKLKLDKNVLEGLTPAQRSGQTKLLSLERDVMESTDELALARREQFAAVNLGIKRSLLEEPGTPAQAREYFRTLLDTRLKLAAEKSNQMIARLGPKITRQRASNLVMEEIIKAKNAASAQERILYDKVDPKLEIGTEAVINNYKFHVKNLGKAQRTDIPAIAKRFLKETTIDAKGKKIANKDYLGEKTTMKEIRALQSKLREDARIARSENKDNRARIANEIADAITEDIEKVGDVSDDLRVALDFTIEKKQRFSQGPVGQLLSRTRIGGRTSPELALESTIAGGGPVSLSKLQSILRASDTPEMRGYMRDFLLDEFQRTAVREGAIDSVGAQRVINKYQDILEVFPDVKKLFNEALQTGKAFKIAQRFADPDLSAAAMVLKAPPEKEIAQIFTSSEPVKNMAQLIHLARTDKSGKAFAGLRFAFIKRLLSRAELSSVDLHEERFISGFRLTKALHQHKDLLPLFYTKKQMHRLGIIVNTAIKMDKARNALPSKEGVLGDVPSRVASALAKIVGAQAGRKVAAVTGGGTVQTPGIFSGEVKEQLLKVVQDPGKKIISDAIQDEKLLKALATEATSIDEVKKVRAVLNAWAISVLKEHEDK